MYNKYDDMKSLTIKKIMAKLNYFFLPKLWNILQKGQCNACKEWNTIAEEIQKQERWLGKVNQPLRTAHPSL
jgi:hypothetical protein